MHKLIKTLIIYILLIFPVLSYGQLNPTFKDYNGKVDKIVVKDFGLDIEINTLFGKYYTFHIPRIYSGWKDIYFFDSIGNIAVEKHYIKRKLTKSIYQKKGAFKNEIIEKTPSYINIFKDFDEYEYLVDSLGRISKVKYWVYLSDSVKRLEMVDEYTKYEGSRLITFTRYSMNLFNFNMDFQNYEVYKIKYDTLGRLASFERWESIPYNNFIDSDTNFTISNIKKDSISYLHEHFMYSYNSKGFIIKEKDDFFDYSSDFKNKTIKSYSFYYKYDKQGNWIKMYSQFNNGKKGLETKRKIKYR